MANMRRREQIVTAALALFDTRGFHGTGMEHIAKEVGMGTSSLYNHVSSKQEVLGEVLCSTMENLLRTHASDLAGLHDPVDKLRASMQSHVRFHALNAQAVRVVNQEFNNLQEPTRSVVRQLRRDYVARWMSIIQDGVDDGVFHIEDAKITCFALIDMGIGVALWFQPDDRYDAQGLGDLYADAALRQCGVLPGA